MAEYLEKSAVIKAIHDEIYDGGKWNGGWYEHSEEQAEKNFTKRINAITPITKEHGEWVHKNIGGDRFCECSVCHSQTYQVSQPYEFCPHCGADMRGEV